MFGKKNAIEKRNEVLEKKVVLLEATVTELEKRIAGLTKRATEFEQVLNQAKDILFDQPKEAKVKKQKTILEFHEPIRAKNLDDITVVVDKKNPFYGKRFVITGLFNTLSREQLANELISLGGTRISAVTSKLDILVVGNEPGPAKLEKIEALRAEGKDITMMYESDIIDTLKKLHKDIIKN